MSAAQREEEHTLETQLREVRDLLSELDQLSSKLQRAADRAMDSFTAERQEPEKKGNADD
jgi:hypothetical protein